MAFPEDRLSTIPEEETYLFPDGAVRAFHEDRDMGPINIGDTSRGIDYQEWHGLYDYISGWITLTPAIFGAPQQIIQVANLTELSFCFDQNGSVVISYVAGGIVSLYWYDTLSAQYETDVIPDAMSAMLTLDDKRIRQSNLNDVLLVYTKETAVGVYGLFHRRQRDRFDPEIDLNEVSHRFMLKLGMHEGLRVQITTTNLGSI